MLQTSDKRKNCSFSRRILRSLNEFSAKEFPIQTPADWLHLPVKIVACLTFLILFAPFGVSSLCAQQAPPDSLSRPLVFGIPIVFFLPETRWGFGAAGFMSWRFRDEPPASRPSQIQLGGAYTLEDQISAYLPFQIWRNDNRFALYGELGWYRYNYFFFGIGNGVPRDFEELYGVEFPRVRITAVREVLPKLYLGGRLIADNFNITDVDPEGMLATGAVPGSRGGLNAGAGLVVSYDSRDNIFDSRSGWFIEADLDRHGAFLASDFTFTRAALDLRYFISLSEKNGFAFRCYTEHVFGAAPFITQPLLGGTRLMRGFYEGRYRGNNNAVVQGEYRRHITGRFGAAAFGAVGAVAPRFGGFAAGNLRATYGAGIRAAVDKEDRINIRFDVGIGHGAPAYYVTVGEAF